MCPFSSRVSLVVALSLRCLRTGVELEERRGWEVQCVLCSIDLSSSRLQKCRSCFVAIARRLDQRSFSHVRLPMRTLCIACHPGPFLQCGSGGMPMVGDGAGEVAARTVSSVGMYSERRKNVLVNGIQERSAGRPVRPRPWHLW